MRLLPIPIRFCKMKKAIQVLLILMPIATMTDCAPPREKTERVPPVILNEYEHGLSKCLEMDDNKDGKADSWLIACGDGTLGVRLVEHVDLDGDGRADVIALHFAHSTYHREVVLNLATNRTPNLFVVGIDTGWRRGVETGTPWFNRPSNKTEEGDWAECYMDRNSDGTPDWWKFVRENDGSYVENVDSEYDGEVDAISIVLSSPRQRDRAAQRPPRIILIRKDQEKNVFFPVGDKGWNEWWDTYKVNSPVLKQERNKIEFGCAKSKP